MSIMIDHAAINAWANSLNGPVAREIEFVTANTVYWIVKDAIDQPAPYSVNKRGWRIYQRNEPPGPPFTRTGRLWQSVKHTRPERDAKGVHCDITVESIPRARRDKNGNTFFDEYDYVREELIPKGYIFVPNGDKRFTIVPRGPGQ